MTYDEKCYELAEHFLPDPKLANVERAYLAQHIQDAIEDWLLTHMKPDFTCRMCGAQCDIAPDPPAQAICPKCCEDHDYEYISGERRHCCKHCGQERPADWFDEP